MPWRISYLAEYAVIETVYAGVLGPQELQAAVLATLEEVRERCTERLLSDCSDLEGGHSVVDLYGLMELLEGQKWGPRFREALLLPQRALPAEDVRSYETFCVNRGFDVRIFDDRSAALAWLGRR